MWASSPILNFVFTWDQDESKEFHTQLMQFHLAHHKENQKPVEWMKAKLGRQNYTWVGEFRFWVWEHSGWRIYASNIQGLSVEVQEDLTKDQVKEAWRDIREKLGLLSENPNC